MERTVLYQSLHDRLAGHPDWGVICRYLRECWAIQNSDDPAKEHLKCNWTRRDVNSGFDWVTTPQGANIWSQVNAAYLAAPRSIRRVEDVPTDFVGWRAMIEIRRQHQLARVALAREKDERALKEYAKIYD